jgi:hypothetical protein
MCEQEQGTFGCRFSLKIATTAVEPSVISFFSDNLRGEGVVELELSSINVNYHTDNSNKTYSDNTVRFCRQLVQNTLWWLRRGSRNYHSPSPVVRAALVKNGVTLMLEWY